MTPQEVLTKAADYIDEHGWTQGEYENIEGKVCVMGAIRRVVFPEYQEGVAPLDNLPSTLYSEAATKFSKWVDDYPLHWNDDVATSQQQVVQTLRASAQL